MRFAVVSLTLALSLAACAKQNPQQPAGGTAKLSWDPVKMDARGKPLTNLAGYKIHYGLSDGAMWYTNKETNQKLAYRM
jgi:hypothetical protein